MRGSRQVAIIGHRGARGLWPENSLDGFRRTRALGVDGVELDVHLSCDRVPVVIHDPTLQRTTEGHGIVAALTAAELATAKLRDGCGQGVPTLDSVLDEFSGSGIELHIEIKMDAAGKRYPGFEEQLVDVIAERGLQDTAILTCFAPRVLETVRAIAPRQRVLLSVNRWSADSLGGVMAILDRIQPIDGCLLAVEKGLLADHLDLCLSRVGRYRLCSGVTNEPEDIAAWLARPVRQIITDRPDLALEQRRILTRSLHGD